jgi:hypothetical protein
LDSLMLARCRCHSQCSNGLLLCFFECGEVEIVNADLNGHELV